MEVQNVVLVCHSVSVCQSLYNFSFLGIWRRPESYTEHIFAPFSHIHLLLVTDIAYLNRAKTLKTVVVGNSCLQFCIQCWERNGC